MVYSVEMTALLAGTVAATLLAGGLAAFTWQRRERPGGRYFAAMMAANALWLLGFAVELTATDVSTALSLFQLRSAVIAFVPALWTLFTLDYADYGDRMTPSVVVAVVAPAVVTAALSFTNPVHGLFWSDPALVTEGPYRLLVVEYAIGWWASVAVSYLLVTAGMVLIASIAVQSTGLYRRQSLLVLGASVAPTLANVAYQTRVSPVPYLDLTPFGFVVNGVVVFWALYDYRLFDISPVARSAVVDRMDDPMVAIDGSGHVVDVNPAALDLSAVADPLGQQFPGAFPEVAAAVDLDADAITDEVAFDAGADARYFEPRLTPLGDRQGAVIVLRDVTRRRSRERSLEAIQAASRDLMRAETPEAVAERTVDAVQEIFGLEYASVHLAEQGELRPVAYTDTVLDLYDPVPSFEVGEGVQGTVLETGDPIVYHDVSEVDALRDEETPLSGVAVFPLGDRGTLGAATTDAFDPDHAQVRLASVLAANAAAAMTRAEREAELRERERTLARQNEQLDEFASVVSHDLRNPISVADGYLELAREEGDVDALDKVADAIDRMERMTDDLLELARSGRDVTDPSPVSLSEAAAEAWGNVDTRGARLDVRTDAAVGADRRRLLQLFENLFRNAVEHGSTSPDAHARRDAVERGSASSRSAADDAVEHDASAGSTAPPRDDVLDAPSADDVGSGAAADRLPQEGAAEAGGAPGDAVLSVSVGSLSADARTDDSEAAGESRGPVGFYVEDDGPGIPPGDRDTVFEWGYSSTLKGTGFGLAIVREVAEAHGWSVSATESDAGGARFEVTGVAVE